MPVSFGPADPVPGVGHHLRGDHDSLNLSGARGDGVYTLSVTETDAAGNTSAAGTATYTLGHHPAAGADRDADGAGSARRAT